MSPLRWYAAHLLVAFKYLKGRQRTFLVHENVYLVRLRDPNDCWKVLAPTVEQLNEPDPSLKINGRRARSEVIGLRKVVSCSLPVDIDQGDADSVVRIVPGVEATFSEFRVRGTANLERLRKGKPTEVEYEQYMHGPDRH